MPKYDNFDLDLQVSKPIEPETNRAYSQNCENTVSIYVGTGKIMLCCE